MKRVVFICMASLLFILVGCQASQGPSVAQPKSHWDIVKVGNTDYRMDYVPSDPSDLQVSVKFINKRDTLAVKAKGSVHITRSYNVYDGEYAPYVSLIFSPVDAEGAKQMEKIKNYSTCNVQYKDITLKNLIILNDGRCVVSIPFDRETLIYSFGVVDKIHTLKVATKKAVMEASFMVSGKDFLDQFVAFNQKCNSLR